MSSAIKNQIRSVISIELAIGNNLNNVDAELNNDITINLYDLNSISNYMTQNSENIVIQNYYNNYWYVASSFCEEMFKMEDDLFKKWNLKDGLYMIFEEEGDYENRSILPIIKENLADKLYNAKYMSEINNEQVLNNCKAEIIKQYNTELDDYAKKYKLDDELIENVKKDMPNFVNEYFDKVAEKILGNNVRDKLESLCDELEIAYNKENLTELKNLTNEIQEYLSKDTTIYRDEDLFKRLRVDLTKCRMAQMNLEKGRPGKLSELEEEMILKFDKEQMEILQRDINKFKVLNKNDIAMADFEMNTKIMKQVLDSLDKK